MGAGACCWLCLSGRTGRHDNMGHAQASHKHMRINLYKRRRVRCDPHVHAPLVFKDS